MTLVSFSIMNATTFTLGKMNAYMMNEYFDYLRLNFNIRFHSWGPPYWTFNLTVPPPPATAASDNNGESSQGVCCSTFGSVRLPKQTIFSHSCWKKESCSQQTHLWTGNGSNKMISVVKFCKRLLGEWSVIRCFFFLLAWRLRSHAKWT